MFSKEFPIRYKLSKTKRLNLASSAGQTINLKSNVEQMEKNGLATLLTCAENLVDLEILLKERVTEESQYI